MLKVSPLDIIKVQSVHVKSHPFNTGLCAESDSIVLLCPCLCVIGSHSVDRVNGEMDSGLFIFFLARYYLEEKNTNY